MEAAEPQQGTSAGSSDPMAEPVPSTSTAQSQNTPATDASLDFAAPACRSTPIGGKQKRDESPMEQAGRTMSALSTLMAAKQAKPNNEQHEERATLTFARHLSNELDAIRSVRLRKQIQLALQQTVVEARLAEEDQV